MCNILCLKAGQMPLEREEFNNMCRNNWHSYGLVTIVDGRMDIKKKVPESGEIDPDEIWDLILKDRQYDRYLHVRHNTAGGTNMENCHPFDVFYQERKGKTPRQVVFMHNGTLYEYKSKIQEGTMIKDDLDPNAPSDTKNFVDKVLTPYISALDFGEGKGDIEGIYLRVLLNKFWPTTSNRGLLISNEQKPLFLGDWKKMKASDGSDIISANDEYFSKVTRGPYKDRLDEEEKKRRAQQGSTFRDRPSPSGHVDTGTGIVPYTCFDFTKDRRHGIFDLKCSFSNITDDWNVWDRGTAVNLGFATQTELKELYQSGEKNTVVLMDWIFSDYRQLYEEFIELEDKHKKATNRIATIQGELTELRKFCADNGVFEKFKKVA